MPVPEKVQSVLLGGNPRKNKIFVLEFILWMGGLLRVVQSIFGLTKGGLKGKFFKSGGL